MSQNRICILILLIMQLSVITVVAPPSTPGPSFSGGSGSGGSHVDIGRILDAIKYAKDQNDPKLGELKNLLYIEPFITKAYNKNLLIGLGATGNKTLTRKDRFVVSASVINPNPIEIRRTLYLYLDLLEPGKATFRTVNSVPVIIMSNDYNSVDGKNVSYTSFPELTSFEDLKHVGPAILKLRVNDGQNIWTTANLTMNIINRPPSLKNLTLNPPGNPRFNDPITYVANATDPDGDPVNMTLHVLNDKGFELRNETQQVSPEEKIVSFVSSDYGFFDKSDSGRNFTYYYTFGDGIAVNNTTIQNGPHLRKSTTIWVGTPVVIPEDDNQNWWEEYNFSLEMKNQDPGEAAVTVSLFTNTEAHPWKAFESKVVKLTQLPQVVYFNVKPFDVLDANKPFDFRFKYSETDQHQKDHIDMTWGKALNAKLVKYAILSGLGIANILLVLLVILFVSILLEWRFYR